MPVFEKNGKKILYIHVPKTAGSSILQLFVSSGYTVSYFSDQSVDLFRDLCGPQHIHASLILNEFTLSEFDYIFSVFRDPVERLVSEYKWRCGISGKECKNFGYWVKKALRKYKKNPFIYDNHIRPQSEFYVEGCDVYDFNTIGSLPNYLAENKGLDFKDINLLIAVNRSSPGFSCKMDYFCRRRITGFYKSDYDWLHGSNLIDCER